MPTGYTYHIENGEVKTGKDFLVMCAREFGACITMRDKGFDEPIPEKFEPNDYYAKALDRAFEKLDKYKNMTLDEAKALIDEEYEKRQEECRSKIIEERNKKKMYTKIKKEIDEWEPPTDGHLGLKKFALDQIKISSEHDYISCYEDELNKPKTSPEDYIKHGLSAAIDDLAYAKKHMEEEKERVDERNAWIKDLRDSLQSM